MNTTNQQLVAALVADCKLRDKLGNPLLEVWTRRDPVSHSPTNAELAWLLSGTFASAVPNDEALEALADHGPIVEIGAGTGYWARLLADRDVDVVAYDLHPHGCTCGGQNRWCGRNLQQWHPVHPAPAEIAAQHPDRTLLIVWPPPNDPMAAAGLDAHRLAGGRLVAHVDDGTYGCSGDEDFHKMFQPPSNMAAINETTDATDRVPYYTELETIELPINYAGTDRLWICELAAT